MGGSGGLFYYDKVLGLVVLIIDDLFCFGVNIGVGLFNMY